MHCGTPCLVHTDTLPLSFTLPTLNSEVGKSSNVWFSAVAFDSQRVGRGISFVAVLVPPLAMLTLYVNFRMMGMCAFALLALLR